MSQSDPNRSYVESTINSYLSAARKLRRHVGPGEFGLAEYKEWLLADATTAVAAGSAAASRTTAAPAPAQVSVGHNGSAFLQFCSTAATLRRPRCTVVRTGSGVVAGSPNSS